MPNHLFKSKPHRSYPKNGQVIRVNDPRALHEAAKKRSPKRKKPKNHHALTQPKSIPLATNNRRFISKQDKKNSARVRKDNYQHQKEITQATKCFLFFMIIACSCGIGFAKEITRKDKPTDSLPDNSKQNSHKKSTISISKSLEEICTTKGTLKSFNKAPIQIGRNQTTGDDGPEICFRIDENPKSFSRREKKRCQRERKIYAVFSNTTLPGPLSDARRDLKAHKFVKEVTERAPPAVFDEIVSNEPPTLPNSEVPIKPKYIKPIYQLANLNRWVEISGYATKIKMGNCLEYNAINIVKILNLSTETDTNIKLQVVYLHNPSNHEFSLLDSHVPDQGKMGQEEVEKVLKNFKSPAKLCDSWNEGFYADADANRNNFYRAHWGKLNIQTISLSFDLRAFPEIVKKFINGELRRLGFKNLFGKPTFTFFSENRSAPTIQPQQAPPSRQRHEL